jgi:GT2 family glycosyltransferase
MADQWPSLAILIVTYNAKIYLPDLFNSLEKTDYPHDKLHLVVVDNASTDETQKLLKSNFHSSLWNLNPIKLIFQPENTGFAKGNNIAAQYAQQFKPKYLVLLNQDTKVSPQWLKELVAVAEQDQKIGVAQSLLLLWNSQHEVLVNSLGNEIHFLGFGFCKGYKMNIANCKLQIANSHEIPYASGAAMLIRNKLLYPPLNPPLYKGGGGGVDLFQENFFMYHEDLDFCLRARLKGWKIVLAQKSIVYHKYEFSKSIKKYYFMERNRLITILQNYKLATLILISPFLFFMELGLLFQALKNGWWKEKLKVYNYFFKINNINDIINKRRDIQLHRTAKDKEVMRYFTGRITHQEISSPLLTYLANPFFGAVWFILRRIIWW